MGFWIFMFVLNLLIPLTLLIIGNMYKNLIPSNVDGICGYRTQRSMLSRQTWNYAHKRIGRTWSACGRIMLPGAALLMLLLLEYDIYTIGWISSVISAIQCLIIPISVLPTEHALKTKFDECGNLKE